MPTAGTTRTLRFLMLAQAACRRCNVLDRKSVTTEGANQVVSATATDANGNHASASVALNIDKTNPAHYGGVTPAAVNGVVTLPAVVSFTCSDALSGTASCPASINVTTAGAQRTFQRHSNGQSREHGFDESHIQCAADTTFSERQRSACGQCGGMEQL